MTSSICSKGSHGWPRRFSAADHLLAISPMLEQNRQREPRIGRERRPSLGRIVSQIAAEQGVSSGTIWRWYRRFRSGGYFALAHTRSDRGRLRYISSHPEIELMIRARMSHGRSAFSIWKSLRLDLGSIAPGYHVVIGYMKQQREAGKRSSQKIPEEMRVA
jgi:hypothetical protein